MFHHRLIAYTMVAATLVACGGDAEDGAAGASLTLAGQTELFPGFDFSTGLQPPGAPVQASFSVAAQGGATVTVDATASGSASEPTLTGVPGAGTVAIAGSFVLAGELHVDISGIPSYDGPIPGLEDTAIDISGSAPLEPFSIGAVVSARADIPPTTLPKIPLPGGIPGKLAVTVDAGSFVEVAFSPSCAGVDGGEATYLGSVQRSGALVIAPAIEIDLPFGGTKTFDIPSFTVDLALGSSELVATAEVGEYAAEPSNGDHQAGSCFGTVMGGGEGGVGGGGVGGSGATAGGGGTGAGAPTEGPTATVQIDGVPMTVVYIDMWTASSPVNHLFIHFTGPGFPGSEHDVSISLDATGVGCEDGNTFWLRPALAPDYPEQYYDSGKADCGADITSLATAPGARAMGTFFGSLRSIAGASDDTKPLLAVTFDVPYPE
jgi:hypothetical protein